MGELKDYISPTQDAGTVHISEDVIASIAAAAVTDVDGVCGLSANLGSDLAEMLGKKNLGKGIKLSFQDDVISIDCYVVALFGYSVIENAKNVQEKVTSAVESMTGRTVRSVNVEICGITLPKDSKK